MRFWEIWSSQKSYCDPTKQIGNSKSPNIQNAFRLFFGPLKLVHGACEQEKWVYNFIFNVLGPLLENRGGPKPCLHVASSM